MNTSEAASRVIEHAYRVAGETDARGKLQGDAFNLFGQARDYYNRALDAQTAKKFEKACDMAGVSDHLSRAAGNLAPRDSQGPTGWTTPVASIEANNSDRAAGALNRAYDELSRPTRQDEKPDAVATKWLDMARDLYKKASQDFSAKRLDSAENRARAADELVQAARHLSHSNQA